MSGRTALVSYLEERSGLRFAGAQWTRMIQALEESSARRGHAADAAYLNLLERDPAAFDDLVDALTVPETYFFREPSAVTLLQEVALPAAARRRGPHGAIAVWCAGCASGEEAYTVAMAAAEVGLSHRVRVLGTDLSPRALAKAETGVYGRWSLRDVDGVRRRRWFVSDSVGSDRAEHRVSDAVRRQVRFARMNLLEGPPGHFDIVLCRNVLIYFTTDAVQRAAAVLRDALRPGGWLLTGASDPPLTLPGLRLVPTAHGLAYRRLRDHQPPAAEPGPARRAATPRRTAPERARARLPVPARPQPGPRIRSLGARDEALAAAEPAITQDPLDAELWYLAAALHLEAGRSADAAAAARAALFLDPGLHGAAALLHHARHAPSHGHALAAEGSPDGG